MKKLIILFLLIGTGGTARAQEYYKIYDAWGDSEHSPGPDETDVFIAACPVCDTGGPARDDRTSYAGVRVYQNIRARYEYNPPGTPRETKEKDNLGFGTTIGVRFTRWFRGEYETLYMGAAYDGISGTFEYDIWANMLNGYLYHEFDHAIAPYIGAGAGVTEMWGSINGDMDNATQISYQGLVGVLFEVNPRIELEAGFKYINFGKINHTHGTTRVDAMQFYLGAIYRFGM